MIGDRKPGRIQRPLWRLWLSVGTATLALIWLTFAHPRLFADVLTPRPAPTVPAGIATPLPTATAAPTATPATRIYHLGETQHLDNIWLTPMALRRLVDHGYPLNAGDEILSLVMTIENRSDQKYTVNLAHFVVQDSNGVQNPHLTYDPSHLRLREVTLIPTGHIRGTITFEVPAHDAHLQLIYSPDIINPNKRKFWHLGPR
ncbi:MAG: hypothetical protein NVSMB65_18920 [Chloroflexota bacterium]